MHAYLRAIQQIVSSYRAEFPNDDEFLRYLPQQLERKDMHLCNRKNFSGHLTASALLLNSVQDSAFLIHHKFLNRWLQPGGHLDEKEEPCSGAKREFLEETGFSSIELHPWHLKTGIPLDIDSHLIPNNPTKLEFSHYHHDFLYVFLLSSMDALDETVAGNRVSLQEEEVTAAKWVPLDILVTGECGGRLARAVQKFRTLSSC